MMMMMMMKRNGIATVISISMVPVVRLTCCAVIFPC
jgi:hypothetical protein